MARARSKAFDTVRTGSCGLPGFESDPYLLETNMEFESRSKTVTRTTSLPEFPAESVTVKRIEIVLTAAGAVNRAVGWSEADNSIPEVRVTQLYLRAADDSSASLLPVPSSRTTSPKLTILSSPALAVGVVVLVPIFALALKLILSAATRITRQIKVEILIAFMLLLLLCHCCGSDKITSHTYWL
jgi:hypothetical protein